LFSFFEGLSEDLLYEEYKDTKGIIRFRKSKKYRQYNGQIEKRAKNDPQNATEKTKYLATRMLLKPGVNSGAPEGF